VKLKAFAKINLSLRVLSLRDDGFHNLESLMQSVSLCDYVTVEFAASGIEVTCDDPRVPVGPKNIAYKAAEKLLGMSDEVSGVRVHIEKRIPMAAGLAGGSADAAAVLFGLNSLIPRTSQLTPKKLLDLGGQIGSDVSFCLTGGICLVEGRGEKVTQQEPWPKTYFILVKPDFEVSTKWAYEEFDKMFLPKADAPLAHNEGKNYLELPVIGKFPEIGRIKEKLLALGCSEAQMSGSGPTVFGVVNKRADAEVILEKIKKEYTRSYLVETIEKGIEALTPNPSSRGRGA